MMSMAPICRTGDGQLAHQLGIGLMPWRGLGGAVLAVVSSEIA
jgi:hypothetical protein